MKLETYLLCIFYLAFLLHVTNKGRTIRCAGEAPPAEGGGAGGESKPAPLMWWINGKYEDGSGGMGIVQWVIIILLALIVLAIIGAIVGFFLKKH